MIKVSDLVVGKLYMHVNADVPFVLQRITRKTLFGKLLVRTWVDWLVDVYQDHETQDRDTTALRECGALDPKLSELPPLP